MINVDIIGSCVSRDIFQYDEQNLFKNDVYIARTSILSNLQHEKWKISDNELKLASKFQKEAVIRDLNKHVYDDFAKRDVTQSYLMIDFIDERFRIAKLDNKYATYSVELMNSKFLEGKDFELLDKVPKSVGYGFTFEGEDIEKYIKEFADKIKAMYQEKRIIIHEAYMCESYIDEKGEIQRFEPHILNDVKHKNIMMQYMYRMLEKYVPEAHIINLFNGNRVLANAKHVWKLAPMHYEDKYYHNALNILKLIIDGNGCIQPKLFKRKKDADEFGASDVEIEIVDDTIKATNNFNIQGGHDIQYSWYVNAINDDKKMYNLYKSPEWSAENTFRYKVRDYNAIDILIIGYVKFTNSEQRVSKIVANIKSDSKGKLYCNGNDINQIDDKNIDIYTNMESISISVSFNGFGPTRYAWYVYENDFNNLVYKSKNFVDNNCFMYIPSNSDSNYYFQIYAKDMLGDRKILKTEGIKLGENNHCGKFGISLKLYNCDMDLLDDKTNLFQANEILNGNLYVHKTSRTPVNIKNGIDWEISHTESPGTFQLWLQALGMIRILARAYIKKNNINYLKKANEILLSWIEYEQSDEAKNNSLVWHDHGSALRVNSIMYFALVAEQAGLIDETAANFIRHLIKRHVGFLIQDIHYTQNHNHGIFQDQALFYCAYFLNDNISDKLLQVARKRLGEQISFAFDEEKVHVENSSAYHIALLYMLDVIAEFLESMGDYFSYYVKANIKESADFCAYLNRPTGNLINTGDSSINDRKIKIDINAEKLGSDAYIYSATQGEKGEAPKNTSRIYPKSGYYFYKENASLCDTFTDATWKMFKAGYSSKTHKHADDLSFAMYSKGHDIFVDTGYYNYNPGNVFCDYFKSSKAHNTVIVDNMSYSVENENAYKVGIYDYNMTNDYDHVIGYNEMYQGVSIDRHFYSSADVTVIYDNIKSEKEHIYTQVFHLSEDINILDANDSEVLLCTKGSEYFIRIRQYVQGSLSIIAGQKKEDVVGGRILGGYISYGQNEVTSTCTLHFSLTGKNIDFVTVITIEDSSFNVIYDSEKRRKIDYQSFYYDENKRKLLFADKEIEFKERIRRNMKSVSVEVAENKLEIKDVLSIDDEFEYEYELINKETYLIFYKRLYSNEGRFNYELPQHDVLIKGKLRRRGRELSKRVLAYIKYDSNTGKHYMANGKYPFLNLNYSGHKMEKINDTEYRFIVYLKYSLDYKIKWYVYRNGAYQTVKMTENENIFDFKFGSSGDYTVSYYIITNLGEKQMYNFESITV